MQASTPIFRLRVLIDKRPAQEYRGPGNNTCIQGIQGKEFELEVVNKTSRRLLVHPVVDGLSAMTGELALKNDSSYGYVMAPWQISTVPGWRLNNNEVAKFVFLPSSNSYAERTSKGCNNGVIACAVWEEEIKYAQHCVFPNVSNSVSVCGETHCSDQLIQGISFAPNATSSQSQNTEQYNNLGTGFGSVGSHHVKNIAFVPCVEPICIAIIYYNTTSELQKRGIRIYNHQSLSNPFSKETGCKLPVGWHSI